MKIPKRQPPREVKRNNIMATEKQKFISAKIKKVMHEGVHGKKVPLKQAVAIAYSYSKKK